MKGLLKRLNDSMKDHAMRGVSYSEVCGAVCSRAERQDALLEENRRVISLYSAKSQ